MTTAELQTIESELGMRLPADYRDLVLSYGFPADSSLAGYAMPNRFADILEMNRAMRAHPWSSAWKQDYFLIGHDGGEGHFFIDTLRERSPVFEISIEDGGIVEFSVDLPSFVDEYQKVDREG